MYLSSHCLPVALDILDVKAKTVSEKYTPLHLAACYLRHACKPCKSTEITVTAAPEVFDQPDSAEQTQSEGRCERMQSDADTQRSERRQSSSAPVPFQRQTSCKQIFHCLVSKLGIDVRMQLTTLTVMSCNEIFTIITCR
jgi:hypothetical protein